MKNRSLMLAAACWFAWCPIVFAQAGEPEGDGAPPHLLTGGVAVGVFNVAGEQEFSGVIPPVTLFADLNFGQWLRFRIGLGQYRATLQENALTTQSVELVYLIGGPVLGPIEAFGLVGVSQVSSTLEVAGAARSVSSSGAAPLFGGMLVYRLGKIRLGAQLVMIQHTGDFEGVVIADGSSQLQMIAGFDWF